MNSVSSIRSELDAIQTSAQVETVQIIAAGHQVIKARIYVTPDLYIQVYRNDRFQTTNFALILSARRIYGRDERGGTWHRHKVENPEIHDESLEGGIPTTLQEFWEQAMSIIVDMDQRFE